MASIAAVTLGLWLVTAPCAEAMPTDVPCDGIVVPLDEARACLSCRNVEIPSRDLTISRLREEARIREAYWRRVEEAHAAELAAALDAIEPDAHSWYESPWFVASVAGVAGVALGAGVVWLATR